MKEYSRHICEYCGHPISIKELNHYGRVPKYHKTCRLNANKKKNRERKRFLRDNEKLNKFVTNLPFETKKSLYDLTFEGIENELSEIKEFNLNRKHIGLSWLNKTKNPFTSPYEGIDYRKNISILIEVIKNSPEIKEYIKSIVNEK